MKLTFLIQRCQSNVFKFKDMVEYKKQMDYNKSLQCLMYFNCNWNPQCEETDKIFDNLSKSPDYTIYSFQQLNVDDQPIARHFYNLKSEPEFIVTCLGAEMARITGINQELLEQKMKRTLDYHQTTEFIPRADTYQKFETEFLDDYYNFQQQQDRWWR